MRLSSNDSVAKAQIRAAMWRERSRSPEDPYAVNTRMRRLSPLSRYAEEERLIGDRVFLPWEAKKMPKTLTKRHRPFFAYYLDVQKNLSLDELTPKEVKGRWKSFVEKW